MTKRKMKKFRKTLKRVDKIKKKAEVVDTFLDENSTVIVEDAFVSQPSYDEVTSVVSEFDGYRDYVNRESGNGLTYGDY